MSSDVETESMWRLGVGRRVRLEQLGELGAFSDVENPRWGG